MIYKCKDCGTEINEGEYKIFGVCDDCWHKVYPRKCSEATTKDVLCEVHSMLDEAMGLLMNHDEHNDKFWKEEYNKLCEKYSEYAWQLSIDNR